MKGSRFRNAGGSGGAGFEDHGFKFEYLTAATLRMAIDSNAAIEDKARVWMRTAGGVWSLVDIPSADLPLTLDLSTTGAGGILAAHAPEAVQGYDVVLIADAGGSNPALLAMDSGTDPGSVTLPGSAVLYSRLLWHASNNNAAAADLIPFLWLGPGHCAFDILQAIDSSFSTATAYTVVDLTDYVPEAFRWALVLGEHDNESAVNARGIQISRDATGPNYDAPATNLAGTAGENSKIFNHFRVGNVAGPDDSCYFRHTGTIDGSGSRFYPMEWRI